MAFVLEIPAVYLDNITLNSGQARPLLMNRDPEPNEQSAPIDTNIAVEITDVGPDGIDLVGLRVYVNTVLAFNAGVFQVGFTGPGSSHSVPQADTRRVVVDRLANFVSEEVVTVRVVAQTVGAAFTLDTSYTFVVEDITAPSAVEIVPQSLRRMRLRFDDDMQQGDPTVASDALNPANYTLIPQTIPSIDAVVTSVESVAPDTVDLIMSKDLTPGAVYQIAVANVLNIAGLLIGVAYLVEFEVFSPYRPPNRSWELIKFLPNYNRRRDVSGDEKKFIEALQESADVMLESIDMFTDILDFERAPEAFLDAMLMDLGNPFPFDIAAVDRRRLAAILVRLYQQKGTEVGIKNAIRFFFKMDVQIIELSAAYPERFAEPGHIPIQSGDNDLGYSLLDLDFILGPSIPFEVRAFHVVAPVVLTAAQKTGITFIVEYMKPAYTHYVDLLDPSSGSFETLYDHLELGISELGSTGTDGTFILH